MIRADPTPADARNGSVFPQGKQTDSRANQTPQTLRVEVEEGIGGRLGRSDPRTPGVKFEPGLTGDAARRGEDASGSVAIYWLSGEA
jgi:hypothetical protein